MLSDAVIKHNNTCLHHLVLAILAVPIVIVKQESQVVKQSQGAHIAAGK